MTTERNEPSGDERPADCERLNENLSAWVLGESEFLSSEEASEIEAHVASCDACRDEVDLLRRTVAVVAATAPADGALEGSRRSAVLTDAAKAVSAAAGTPPGGPGSVILWRLSLLAAAAVLVGCLVPFLAPEEGGDDAIESGISLSANAKRDAANVEVDVDAAPPELAVATARPAATDEERRAANFEEESESIAGPSSGGVAARPERSSRVRARGTSALVAESGSEANQLADRTLAARGGLAPADAGETQLSEESVFRDYAGAELVLEGAVPTNDDGAGASSARPGFGAATPTPDAASAGGGIAGSGRDPNKALKLSESVELYKTVIDQSVDASTLARSPERGEELARLAGIEANRGAYRRANEAARESVENLHRLDGKQAPRFSSKWAADRRALMGDREVELAKAELETKTRLFLHTNGKASREEADSGVVSDKDFYYALATGSPQPEAERARKRAKSASKKRNAEQLAGEPEFAGRQKSITSLNSAVRRRVESRGRTADGAEVADALRAAADAAARTAAPTATEETRGQANETAVPNAQQQGQQQAAKEPVSAFAGKPLGETASQPAEAEAVEGIADSLAVDGEPGEDAVSASEGTAAEEPAKRATVAAVSAPAPVQEVTGARAATPASGSTETKPVVDAKALVDEFCRRIAPRSGEAPDLMFFRYWGTNPFVEAIVDPLSTFAVDTDSASYTLLRKYLMDRGLLPPTQAIRTEEFINYFRNGYEPPSGGDAFAIHTEMAPSPFGHEPEYQLLKVGIKGREVSRDERKGSSLVFVVDTSGSMRRENRLELVKDALRLLVKELDEGDSIGIVAFDRESRVVLEPTPADQREKILNGIGLLESRRNTNVDAGLRAGYAMSEKVFDANANNRVILLSDGVANTGVTDVNGMLENTKAQRAKGIYLTCVGVGMGNHNDTLLEQLADRGDGQCVYVDRIEEARKVFVESLVGTLETIARDVKIQVEFDKEKVIRYRLLGYENRAIADSAFRDNTVDAGEIGAGHEVTALYELKLSPGANGKLATVRVRHLKVDDGSAVEVERLVDDASRRGTIADSSARFRLSAYVAEFAEVLRDSYWARGSDLSRVAGLTRDLLADVPGALGPDPEVAELVALMLRAAPLVEKRHAGHGEVAEVMDALRENTYHRTRAEQVQSEGEQRAEYLEEIQRQNEQLRRRLESLIEQSYRQ